MSTIGYLLGTALLILLNAFFVASEFAIVKMRPTRLEQLVHSGDSRAKRALAISQRLDAYLSANQLGITLASLGLGWIGEPAVAHLLQPLLVRIGFGPDATHAISLGAHDHWRIGAEKSRDSTYGKRYAFHGPSVAFFLCLGLADHLGFEFLSQCLRAAFWTSTST
jgi:hypothetical protein